MLGAGTLGALASSPVALQQATAVLERLEPDDYVAYLLSYYRTGLGRFGDHWRYADIVTVLQAAARLLRPERYLEIGVRRGRSMAIVAAACPGCEIIGFDLWVPDYAGMPNPGPAFVRGELARVGHAGSLELIGGNSHDTVPQYLREHPDAFFDLITVDGDHSRQGAAQDLRDVLPRLKVGGVLVFDDIAHPALPHLDRVWRRVVVADQRFSTWEFSELGYGVALAVRKW
jgi:predicted O-methyltransferase YrrM